MYTLSVLDAGTRVLTGAPSLPASRVDDLPVVKSFARMEPARSTRFSTEFYDLYRESEQLFRTVRAYQREGRVEEAQALREGHREELGRRRALLGANKQLTGIRKQIERVYRDEDMSPEEKRTRLDALYQRRNQVTRQAVERATAAR